MAFDSIPQNLRTVRACLVCSLVKEFDQFEHYGCDNCEEFLGLKNSPDNIFECTSSNFEGLISMTSPKDSWVAKWQRIGKFSIGMYAISVAGKLPKNLQLEIKTLGVKYRSRDTSQ